MAAKKRANGLGSKPKQRKDGRFYSNYTVYVKGPKGKVSKTKAVYGKTPTECERTLIRRWPTETTACYSIRTIRSLPITCPGGWTGLWLIR